MLIGPIEKVLIGVFQFLFAGMFLTINLTGIVYIGLVGYYLVF